VRCRGADSRARRCTCSPYRPPLKRYAPIASVAALSERHAGWQSLRHTFCGVKFSSLSLRGVRRPTWRPEREARGSALGVQSRGTCPDHKKPRRKRKTFYRDIFRQNVFDISAASGYNKDVETRTVATIIKHLSGL
jgi:hypothetical protein